MLKLFQKIKADLLIRNRTEDERLVRRAYFSDLRDVEAALTRESMDRHDLWPGLVSACASLKEYKVSLPGEESHARLYAVTEKVLMREPSASKMQWCDPEEVKIHDEEFELVCGICPSVEDLRQKYAGNFYQSRLQEDQKSLKNNGFDQLVAA